MRVVVRALIDAFTLPRLRVMGRMHVELHRQAAGDEVLAREAARQLDPVLGAELPVRRQRQDDLARHLGVAPPLGAFRDVPQLRAGPECGRSRALWQEQGEEPSKASFMWVEAGSWSGYPDGEADDTHLSRDGALAIARLVVDDLVAHGLLDEPLVAT